MHTPILRFAEHTRRHGATVLKREVSMALLPPIPLYRRLLRAHRKHLPAEGRLLGDAYVKSEFRLHRNVEDPVLIVGFLTEWQLYAQKLEGGAWREGENIDPAKLEKMSDEQLAQLYKLMMSFKGTPGAGGGEPSREDGEK